MVTLYIQWLFGYYYYVTLLSGTLVLKCNLQCQAAAPIANSPPVLVRQDIWGELAKFWLPSAGVQTKEACSNCQCLPDGCAGFRETSLPAACQPTTHPDFTCQPPHSSLNHFIKRRELTLSFVCLLLGSASYVCNTSTYQSIQTLYTKK